MKSQKILLKKEEKNNLTKAINGTQKNIIEGTLKFYLEDVCECKDSDVRIAALESMLSMTVSEEQKQLFVVAGIWESISIVRKILSHPYPQNRTENYPYFGNPEDPNIIVYKDIFGKAAFEPKGLLSLTARNDDSTPPVTKEAVYEYITSLIKKKLCEEIISKYEALNVHYHEEEWSIKYCHHINDINAALIAAVKKNNLFDVNLAIKCGADVNYEEGVEKETPLILASERGNIEIVELLLKKQANINGKKNRINALIVSSNEKITRKLLEYGADPDHINSRRLNSLSFAIQKNQIEIMILLLQYGANPNLIAYNNFSSLDFAIYHHRHSMIPLLISNGALVNSQWIENEFVKGNSPFLNEESKKELVSVMEEGYQLKKIIREVNKTLLENCYFSANIVKLINQYYGFFNHDDDLKRVAKELDNHFKQLNQQLNRIHDEIKSIIMQQLQVTNYQGFFQNIPSVDTPVSEKTELNTKQLKK